MRLHKVLHQVVTMAQPIVKKLESRVKAWMKPATNGLIGGTAADLAKSKPEWVVENAFLRLQVIVLNRQVARPRLTTKDRGLLVLLASRVRDWKNALLIVKPETLLRWHRQASSCSGGRNRRGRLVSRGYPKRRLR
jgi:hypothetical protein